jgi:S-DNA-T family DNA segregation ATPase FtsK/SpoIIIE
VLLVTEDDRTLYLGSAVRMLWRYRSELAPCTAALCMLVYGAWAHSRNPAGAWPLAGLTAAVTAGLGVPPGRWPGRAGRALVGVLDRWAVYARQAERLYAASVVALAGSWLSAATRWGPGTAPLPAVLLLGTLAGGLPWWTHRRRRARVRVTRTLDAWPTFSESIGLPGSRVTSALVDRWGWSGRLALRRGQTVAQAIAAAPAIESALAVRPGAVRVEPDPSRADRAVLRVIESDPLAVAVPWPGLPAAGTTEDGRTPSVLDPIPLGLFEDGSPILLRLAYRNVLIGGIVGSGKSGVLNVILAVLVACRDLVVWGVDLKGGMELRPWSGCLGRLATTPAEAVELLRDARTIRRQRAAALGDRRWDPRRDGPALIVLVDEFAELPEEAKRDADSIARMGRAVMVNLLMATQRPTQDAMGNGAIRQQSDVRICLRVRERRDTDLILGQGFWAGGWRADQLDAPGKLLLSDPEHTVPRPGRGYLISDPHISEHAAEHAGRQPDVRPDPQPNTTPPQNHDGEHDGKHDGDNQDDQRDQQGEPEPDGDQDSDRGGPEDDPDDDPDDPDRLLWDALSLAPEEGVTVPELVILTGLSRPTIYRRLREYADSGRAVQVGWGRWRTPPSTPSDLVSGSTQ